MSFQSGCVFFCFYHVDVETFNQPNRDHVSMATSKRAKPAPPPQHLKPRLKPNMLRPTRHEDPGPPRSSSSSDSPEPSSPCQTEVHHVSGQDDEDWWNTAGHKGSSLSMQEALADTDPDPLTAEGKRLHGYENVHLQRTKSQIMKGKRNVYQNTEVVGMPLPRRHSEVINSSSTDHPPIALDNLSLERPTSMVDVSPGDYVSDDVFRVSQQEGAGVTDKNALRRDNCYVNVVFPVDKPQSLDGRAEPGPKADTSRHLSLDKRSQVRLGQTGLSHSSTDPKGSACQEADLDRGDESGDDDDDDDSSSSFVSFSDRVCTCHN